MGRHQERHWWKTSAAYWSDMKNMFYLKKTLCFAYWSGTTDAFAIGLPRVTDRKKKARD
jgi:hypothetical protein